MALKNVFTHAFDWFYKMVPENQYAITSSTYFDATIGTTTGTKLIQGYYNTQDAAITRQSASLLRQYNPHPELGPLHATIAASESAMPWGCGAIDYLWNISNWSHSIEEKALYQNATYPLVVTHWQHFHNFMITSKSHFNHLAAQGAEVYPITSSWHPYEPLFIARIGTQGVLNGSGSLFRADGSGSGLNPPITSYAYKYPATARTIGYALPHSASTDRPKWTIPFSPGLGDPVGVGANPDWVYYDATSVAGFDGRFFDLGGGAGIMRSQVSASLVEYNSAGNDGADATIALKKRRLFMPIVSTGSAAGFNGHLNNYFGIKSDEFFDENGGIYNVKFNLKRDIALDYYPDQGTELLVFIADVRSTLPNNVASRVAGTPGFYPPEANIVRIKNQPAMSFINPATGFQLESFNINVIQYGLKASLCFEVSGSLDDDKYFGCVIDDVEFCKVGVTEDPSLIAPTSTGAVITAEQPYVPSQLD